MGKFDGYLFCSDLDDTLLTTDKEVSEQNVQALKYFMENGGRFTFATGRVPRGIRQFLKYIVPNAPVICFNGGAIYDYSTEKFVWQAELPKNTHKVVDFVDKAFPSAGIEICGETAAYFHKLNRLVEEHKIIEQADDNDVHYNTITEPWRKVLFMVEEDEMPALRKVIADSGFDKEFNFVQSAPWYYELLPKGITKGTGLLKLAEYLGIEPQNTIGMGDNENDLGLVQDAGLGVAVYNAAECVIRSADMVTADNNSHAAMAVIEYLDKKL